MLRKLLVGVTATSAVTALLLGCAASSGSNEAPIVDEEDTIAITVGAYATNYFSARIQLGIESGIFERHGLEVSIMEVANPAAVVPAVVSGEVNFGPSGPVSTMIAIDQGLPVKIVSSNFLGPSSSLLEGTPGQGVFAHSSKALQEDDWAGLNGSTIGVICLRCDGELLVRNSIDSAPGGDSSTIDFVQLPSADMWEALRIGELDAATINQPFTSRAFESEEVNWIGNQVDAMGEVWTPSLMLGNEQWTQANPVATERFIAAMNELVPYIGDHEEELRSVTASYFNLKDEEAQALVFPYIQSSEIPQEVIELALKRSQEYGWVSEKITVDDLFVEQVNTQ